MFEVDIYIETDSISPKPTEKWFGYVMECKVKGEPKTVDGFGTMTGTYHKAVLTALAESLDRLNQSCEVHIHTKDEFVLNMMERNLETWASSEFKTTKGKPVANREEWEKLWKISQEQLLLPDPGENPYAGWIHREIEKRKEV